MSATQEGAQLARQTWRTVEPVHAMVYFVPEATDAYAALGTRARAGYFASRAAPMGAVPADVVISTFFNFNPDLVHRAVPHVWQLASPEAFLEARLGAVDAACRRLLGDEVLASAEMARAAILARTVAESAATRMEGRPLAAAHAGLAWPEAPHLVLWHAESVLREFRGDGHIALLVTHELSGLEALITHAAAGEVAPDVLQSSRAWPDEAWQEAMSSLRARGWLQEGEQLRLTERGAARRQAIEDGTDVLAAAPYEELGQERCAELRRLVRPWSRIFAEQLR